jgi:hypothetical protein
MVLKFVPEEAAGAEAPGALLLGGRMDFTMGDRPGIQQGVQNRI